MVLLIVLTWMELICSDHGHFQDNVTHKIERFFELLVICVGCFVTAIQTLEWSLLECMISFQRDGNIQFNELVVQQFKYRERETKRI